MRHVAIALVMFGCQAGDGLVKPPATPSSAPVAAPTPPTPTSAAPVAPTPTPPAPSTAPIGPTASTVTHDLPPSAIESLVGCWSHDTERWTFKPDGDHGLVVVREVDDKSYADRARRPAPVSYDPTSETFGFAAAGRIHGLMMLFHILPKRTTPTLETSVYTSHDGHSYGWTGNTWTLTRC